MDMGRLLLLLPLLTGVVSGSAIIKHVDDIQQQQEEQQQIHAVSDSKLQTYTSQKSRPRPLEFYYPTYPDYAIPEYTVQQGYNSLLVPSTPNSHSGWSSGFMSQLIPLSSTLLSYGLEAGAYISHFMLTAFLGSIITVLVCTFTPVCSISFMGFGINKSQVKEQVADLARTYITPENLNAATILMTKAIDKYTSIQHEKKDKSEKKEEVNKDRNNTANTR